jgi:hypothetical protein
MVYQISGPNGKFTPTASTIKASSGASFIWGFHVNGFNVANPTSTSTSNSQTSPSQISPSTSTPNPLPISATPSATSINSDRKTSSLAAGAIAGLVIGIIVLLSSVILGTWIIRRRRRMVENSKMNDYSSPVVAGARVVHDLQPDRGADVHGDMEKVFRARVISELPQPERKQTIHEMGGNEIRDKWELGT